MSSVSATIFALALYAAAAGLVIAVRWSRAALVLPVLLALLLGLGFYQTGVTARDRLARTDMVVPATPATESQCAQIVKLMKQSGLTVDRTDPANAKLLGPNADQVPAEAKPLIIACMTESQSGQSKDKGPSQNDPAMVLPEGLVQ